jgi:hypothetical protein
MSKYSSYEKQQKLFENWRRYLKEATEQREIQKESSEAVQVFITGAEKYLPNYVTMLKQIAVDPEFRKLAMAGQTDAGGPNDEALTISSGTDIPAKDLTPTQQDIDMEKSLGDQMINKWDDKATLSALQDPVMMPSPGGKIPILTYNNKYILDGHHRWSQVMMTNPGAKMKVDNLSGTALKDEETALKATQLAIAALAGKVKTKSTNTNLLKQSEEAIGVYVRNKISQEVLDLLVRFQKIPEPTEQTKDDAGRNKESVKNAAQYYMRNLAAIKAKPPGEFVRVQSMPQADDSGAPQADVNKALEQGKINFDNPQASDSKRRTSEGVSRRKKKKVRRKTISRRKKK